MICLPLRWSTITTDHSRQIDLHKICCRLFFVSCMICNFSEPLLCRVGPGLSVHILSRGTILNRTYVTHNYLCISLFFLTIFGIYCGPEIVLSIITTTIIIIAHLSCVGICAMMQITAAGEQPFPRGGRVITTTYAE